MFAKLLLLLFATPLLLPLCQSRGPTPGQKVVPRVLLRTSVAGDGVTITEEQLPEPPPPADGLALPSPEVVKGAIESLLEKHVPEMQPRVKAMLVTRLSANAAKETTKAGVEEAAFGALARQHNIPKGELPSLPVPAAEPEPPGPLDSPFEIKDQLGSGNTGGVFLATNANGDDVAIKYLAARPFGRSPPLDVEAEIKAGSLLGGATPVGNAMPGIRVQQIIGAFKDAHGDFFLVQPVRAGGDVDRHMDAIRADPAWAKEVAEQAFEGLQQLHRHGVIHGDVKTENILLGGQGVESRGRRGVDGRSSSEPGAVVADLGSCLFAPGLDRSASVLESPSVRGTPGYQPPEAFTKGGGWKSPPVPYYFTPVAGSHDTRAGAADYFAMGVALCQLFFRDNSEGFGTDRFGPWDPGMAKQFYDAIEARSRAPATSTTLSTAEEAGHVLDLIKQLTAADWEKRSVTDPLEHPFFAGQVHAAPSRRHGDRKKAASPPSSPRSLSSSSPLRRAQSLDSGKMQANKMAKAKGKLLRTRSAGAK